MRARRSDYVQLHRPPDVPYAASFDNRLQTKGKHSDKNFLNPLEESPESNLESNPGAPARHIERSPSGTVGKIPLSYRSIRSGGLDRNREGVENQYGAPERVFSSGEWNLSAVREQFKLPGATERTRTALLDPTLPAGEQAVGPALEQRFIKSGLWPPASAGDVGITNCGGIGASGSSSSLRQTSGGSFIDSIMSSDFPLSSLSPTISFSTSDSALLGGYHESSNEDGTKMIRPREFSSQSWAQQTEQSYNLQMALALRLVATADLTEEPLLYANAKENRLSISAARSSAAATALRFWINGSLGYSDKIQDGFYHIWGINPHIWAICNDTKEGGLLPSLDVLQQVDPSDSSMEVVLFDKHGDSHLRDLEHQVVGLAYKAASLNELAESLGELVCSLMGGAASSEDGDLVSRWRATSSLLKDCVSCLVIPVGSLSVGLCRHRALLYKALADSVELPCRITRGCKYCGLHDGASCLVLCGNEREWLVDLIANPGDLSSAESFLKNLQSPPIYSPLRLPDLKVSEMTELNVEADLGLQVSGVTQLGSKCKQSMLDKLGATPAFNGPVSARLGSGWSFIAPAGECKSSSLKVTRPDNKMSYEIMSIEGRNLSCHLGPLGAPATSDRSMPNKHSPSDKLISVKIDRKDYQNLPELTALQVQDLSDSGTSRGEMEETDKEVECQAGNVKKAQKLDLSLALDGFEIPWADLILRERIGAGSFGTVHRADWHGSDVAVKILIEQDFQDERLQEFVREVALMKRMRHPNIVLFMGAVTKCPNFSIVTEYLPRGSLFRLLHRAGVREMLDEKRRIRMALDVAKGMNYLHRMNPPIVHRDLKSPNLLVDKTWTVKVCDFGLSRFKGNTFLSSRSAAGTPEWMAPEVLRDEPSNEKADVYSFGIILWELVTLQQPWNGLSPAQVVGAVGFQNRRLHIPKDVNPEIAALIEACFSDDPQQRPSFASIMESLKNIQKISVTAGGATNA